MNAIAIIHNKYEITWALIIIVLTVLTWFFFIGALYPPPKKGRGVLWLYLPLSVGFSFFFSRLIYWYSHQSSFDGFLSALKSGDLSAFALLGILPGLVLAAGLLRLVRLIRDLPWFLDLVSVPTLLAMGLFSLTCLFGDSCRGKTIITAPFFCRLPFSIATLNQQGETEYRFATFFVAFLLLTLLCFVALVFYLRNKAQKGATACFSLLLFSGAEFVLESTRYDAGYFPANGFVSILQIAAAVFIVGVTVYFSIFAKKKGVRISNMIPFWILLLLSMGGTGYLEYLVQRHGDRAVLIHSGMAFSVLCMVIFPCILYFLAVRRASKNTENIKAAADSPNDELLAGVDSYLQMHYREELKAAPVLKKRAFEEAVEESHEEAPEEAVEEDFSEEDNCEDSAICFDRMEKCASVPQMAAAESMMGMAASARSLSGLMMRVGETWQQSLFRLIDEKGYLDTDVYKRAGVDRKLFSKIRSNPDYQPKKITAVAFALALHLSLDEAKDFLGRAGYAFSPSSKFDLIVEYFIKNEVYDFYTINLALFDHDQPLLGE